MFGVILALQSSSAVHLRVDNLGVVRHVGRLLDGHSGSIPFELVKDGDLLLLIQRMLHLRGLDTVRVTKVKGHADEGMVLDGRVRLTGWVTMQLTRLLTLVGGESVMLSLMRVVICLGFVVAGTLLFLTFILTFIDFSLPFSRAVANHDGRDGTARTRCWHARCCDDRCVGVQFSNKVLACPLLRRQVRGSAVLE